VVTNKTGATIGHIQFPLVDLAAAHREIGAELETAALRVIRSGRFVGGPVVTSFEAAFGAHVGSAEAVGVANGTDAVELAQRALGLGAGAEVLVPANTFIATASAVVAAGAVPAFVDVEPDSGLLDLSSCEQRLSPRTEALIVVHLYGRLVDMDPVLAFARRHGLAVIEDAAQAHGAAQGGRRAGSIGDVGCFSFYPGKNLGAFGDAGAVVSDDAALAARVRLLSDHGRGGPTGHAAIGRNSRLDPLHAAVLEVKLAHLDDWNARRRRAAGWYRETLPPELLDWRAAEPDREVHHLFPVLTDARDELGAELQRAGVQTGIHYATVLPATAAFAEWTERCPVAVRRAERQLSLPMHPHLRREDVEHIAALVAGRIPVNRS
jgi:dTDP-4-amino-4,6-dideoxygalactose transaminase